MTVFKILLVLLILICAVVIIVDCTKPISYGVEYKGTDGSKIVLYRNNTYKYVGRDNKGKIIKQTGTYTLSQEGKSKGLLLSGFGLFTVNSRTSIRESGGHIYKSIPSDGIIACSVLLGVSVLILLFMYYRFYH